jgi:hypothetical protein
MTNENDAEKSGLERKPNPVLVAVRKAYVTSLRNTGASREEMQEKVRSYMQDTVRPVLREAQQQIREQQVKADKRAEFMKDYVSRKLGISI